MKLADTRSGPWLRSIALAALAIIAFHVQAQAVKPLKKVTIALGTPVINVSYPFLTLPLVLGYWKEEGYDVNIVTTSGSLQSVQQMVAGRVDFAELNSTGLIQAVTENNVPVRALMANGVIDWGVGVMPDGPIKVIGDIRGKKIGIVSLGTGGMVLLKGYLRANGINPDADVQIIPTGAGAPALEALKSDRVQALMFWKSAFVGFENAGTKLRILFDPAWRMMPDFTFATLQTVIDGDAAMTEGIARGVAKASLFAQTNPECTRRIHWKNFPSTKPTGADEPTLIKWDLALLQAQLDSMAAAHTMNGGQSLGAINPAAYGRMQDFMFKDGMIKQTRPIESMLYLKPGFVDAINRFDHGAVIEAAKQCRGS